MTMKFVLFVFMASILPFYLVEGDLGGICDLGAFIANIITKKEKIAELRARIPNEVEVFYATPP